VAEARRLAEAEKKMAQDEKERAKKEEEALKEREEKQKQAAEKVAVDNNEAVGSRGEPVTPKNRDPNVVCVVFEEGVTEDWCYAACMNGVCPFEAKGKCMCAKGAEKPR